MGDSGTWRKSTFSGTNGGGCVEVANSVNGVLVRDTTNRNGGTLAVSTDVWGHFIATLR
jgi:hypothetical protein